MVIRPPGPGGFFMAFFPEVLGGIRRVHHSGWCVPNYFYDPSEYVEISIDKDCFKFTKCIYQS